MTATPHDPWLAFAGVPTESKVCKLEPPDPVDSCTSAQPRRETFNKAFRAFLQLITVVKSRLSLANDVMQTQDIAGVIPAFNEKRRYP